MLRFLNNSEYNQKYGVGYNINKLKIHSIQLRIKCIYLNSINISFDKNSFI